MSNLTDRIKKLSPKQLLLLALDQQERLDAAERRRREPIAVIGMSCRFPGGPIARRNSGSCWTRGEMQSAKCQPTVGISTRCTIRIPMRQRVCQCARAASSTWSAVSMRRFSGSRRAKR